MKLITKSNDRTPHLLILFGLVAALGLALLPSVFAADFTAANEGELVTAINAANAAGAGDHSIVLTADITLSAPLPALNNPTAGGIVVDGAGHTLDAGQKGTALAVMRGTTATIQDMTITGGAGNRGNDSKSGGGIFNMGHLSAVNVTLTGNTATEGAGIFNYGGEGGDASLNLNGVEITGNSATTTGGGIANRGDEGTAAITGIDSTISGNSAAQYGGGIANVGLAGTATVALTNTAIAGNSGDLGGGLFNNGNGGEAVVTLTRVTVSGNTAQGSGGGLLNNGNSGTAQITLTNSTVSGNSTPKNGGGLTNSANGGTATVTLRFATLAANSAATGGSLYNTSGAVVDAAASLFVHGASGKACAFTAGATLTSGGYNLDSDDSCTLAGTGDVAGGSAALSALALNAPGQTETHALGEASDALDKVPAGAAGCGASVTVDQRGATRPQPGPLCDIGAYERGEGGDITPTATATASPTVTGTPPSPTPTTSATPPTPTPTATGPAPVCAPPYLPATGDALNDAITCVNAAGAGSHVITLAADITLDAATIPLDNAAADNILIDGDGHKLDGNFKGTVLTIAAGTTVHIRDVKLINGQGSRGPGSAWGGGIFNEGDLTIETSTISGSLAERGAAIANYGGGSTARVRLVRSTLSGNAALASGGGVLNLSGPDGGAVVEIENSTLSGNLAVTGGGGIFNESGGGSAMTNVRFTTLGLNTSSGGGGGIHAAGGASTVSMAATIITNGSGAGPDCAVSGGNLISVGYNLAGDGTCDLDMTSDQPAANAVLLPLATNPPGTTATFALGHNSPALNAIPVGVVGCGTTVNVDQRGVARPMPAGDICDIGAYERQTKEPEVSEQRLLLPIIVK